MGKADQSHRLKHPNYRAAVLVKCILGMEPCMEPFSETLTRALGLECCETSSTVGQQIPFCLRKEAPEGLLSSHTEIVSVSLFLFVVVFDFVCCRCVVLARHRRHGSRDARGLHVGSPHGAVPNRAWN